MDIKDSIESRWDGFRRYDRTGFNRYDWAREGILTKCLPKVLFKGNSVLVTFLQLIDLRLVMMFRLIDKIKRFRYLTWIQ
jgi:hypothetical protein